MPHLMPHDTSVSLGHDEPQIRFTYMANEQQTKTLDVQAGLSGGKPTATATFTYAGVKGATTAAAEDMVCPKFKIWKFSNIELDIQPSPCWVVESEDTDEKWNSAIMSYSAFAVKIYRWPQGTLPIATISRNMKFDVKYGVSVEVATPVQKVCYY